jgi:hypothetical protein
LFVRTGITPRVAKKMLTGSEVAELRAYYRRFPFDDENSIHVPQAQLAALYANTHRAEGATPRPIEDFLVFRPEPEDEPDELDHSILKFFESL